MRAVVFGFMLVLSVRCASAQQAALWRVTEELRIGSVDGDTALFGFVSGMRVDARGNVYVAIYPERVIRMFDSTGKLKHSLGRGGKGPGEFESIVMLGFQGDTLLVSDHILSRISLFADGRFVRAFTMPRVDLGFPFLVRGGDDLLPDGSLVVDPGYHFRPGSHMRVPLVRVGREGSVDTIAVTDYVIRTSAWEKDGRVVATAPARFLFHSTAMVVQGGTHGFVLDRPEALRAGRAQFVIHKVQMGGDTIWSRSYDYRVRPVTRAVIDSVIDAEAKRLEGRLGMAAKSEYRKKARFPEYFPAFQTVRTTREGGLWIKTYDGTRTTNRWLILDADGNVQAQMHLAPGVDPRVVRDDAMYAVVRDELDVAYVVRYRIQKVPAKR